MGDYNNLHYIPGLGQTHEILYATNDLFIPALLNAVDPPFDSTLPAVGSYNGLQYTWNVISQVWQPTGTGVDNTNWSFNNTFAS